MTDPVTTVTEASVAEADEQEPSAPQLGPRRFGLIASIAALVLLADQRCV